MPEITLLPDTNVCVQNARRLLTGSGDIHQQGAQYRSVTLREASELLGVSAERVRRVLEPVWEDDFSFDFEPRRRRQHAPRYDIAHLMAVKNNLGCGAFDPIPLVAAEEELRLLRLQTEPTEEDVRRFRYVHVTNIFRQPAHFVPKFGSRETAELVLRRALTRAVAWSEDRFFETGFTWEGLIAYGDFASERTVERGLRLFAAFAPCPGTLSPAKYRNRLTDVLMTAGADSGAELSEVPVIADWVMEEKRCQAFAAELDARLEAMPEVSAWFAPWICGTWKDREEDLQAALRRALHDYPIAGSLNLRQLMSFAALFDSPDSLREVLDAGPDAPDSRAHRRGGQRSRR